MVRAVIRVGDEVECIFAGPWRRMSGEAPHPNTPAMGQVLRVVDTALVRGRYPALVFAEFQSKWNVKHFRKVQRRDLQAWLRTAVPAPHLDKRKRAGVRA